MDLEEASEMAEEVVGVAKVGEVKALVVEEMAVVKAGSQQAAVTVAVTAAPMVTVGGWERVAAEKASCPKAKPLKHTLPRSIFL